MERSAGDFRHPRDMLSDIAEVPQELSEGPRTVARSTTQQEATRDFATHTALSSNHPNSDIHYADPIISGIDISHNTLRPHYSDREGPAQQFEIQDWATWCESEIVAGTLPENPEFKPHYLDTISEDSDDEFIVKKLGVTASADDLERPHSPAPNQTTESLINEAPSEDSPCDDTITKRLAKPVSSLDEVQDSSSAWLPTQQAVLDEIPTRNKEQKWLDPAADEEDQSCIETQRLRHVFDYDNFVAEASAVSHLRQTERLSSDEEFSEGLVASTKAQEGGTGHFDQRIDLNQGGEELNHHPQGELSWLSTRSNSIDESHNMGVEPLLTDERLSTIDVAYAPTKALPAEEPQVYALEDTSISDLELRSIRPRETQRAGLGLDLYKSPYAETSTDEDHSLTYFRTKSMPSSNFESPNPMSSGVDSLDDTCDQDRSTISIGTRNQRRPMLVHSSAQTDEELVHSAASSSEDRDTEERRFPTPAIVLPDLADSKIENSARAKSLKKKRRQHFREVEENVAAAVVIYATAQELSLSPSPSRGYGRINRNITETLGVGRGPVQASSDAVSSEISAQHSFDESDFSSSVADLSTDDERHRHRSRRSHHHSSRPRETVSGDEYRRHHHREHKSRDEGEQSAKVSSDRSMSSRHRKEEPLRRSKEEYRRHDGGHESPSHRRHRTPEEQAAHDKRKEERRAQRERERELELSREQKGKEAETTPPSSIRHSPRSSRRSGQSDLRPGHSSSERRVSIKEEPSPVSSRKLFNFRGGESILDAARVSPEDEMEAPPNRISMRSHFRSHRESGDASRTQREHREPRENRESRELREPREHRQHKEHREHREHRAHRVSGDVPRPRSSRHNDEIPDSPSRHRERSSRTRAEEDPKFSARSMPESEGRISTRSRADSDARRSTRSRGNDSDGKPSSQPSSSSHKPHSTENKEERHHRHSSRREERQRERDAERKKREAPQSGLKAVFRKLFA
ncbi:hypothetical protein RRF57_004789 [Xylaria bambusicola]|uniref:Uncharacterized protein n=1 Tax=Xylaria bambusicola TaxID=326684 RepID=A0AAN7UWX6_9PEZI